MAAGLAGWIARDGGACLLVFGQMLLRMTAPVLALALAPIVSSCAAGAFACSTDTQCNRVGGVCQPNGWCSFPDDACPSGFRYGEHAGDGLAGTCVPDVSSDGSETSVSTGADTTSGLGSSGDPDDTTSAVSTSTSDTGGDEDSTSSTTGAPNDPSLVAWYTFDDPRDPYADASGNELHAWCVGAECPGLVEGVVGSAIELDGVQSHLHVSHVPELELLDALTVAVWAKADTFEMSYASIVAKPVGSQARNSWQVGINADGDLSGLIGNSVEARVLNAQIDEGDLIDVWHHIAITWDGDQLTLYIDGLEHSSVAGVPLEYDDQVALIGADSNYYEDTNFFSGAIDDVRVYDRTLDAVEIQAIAGM
jgi:hypothetical protein